MIVKDEEACLERCLQSVQGHVDEIVVVDTGSTDRTVEIARRFGARVYHHPWENDFSRHRNQSLSYATGDWILQLDADEEFFVEDIALLHRTIAAGTADYYHCQFHDIRHDGSVHGVFYLIRLFRNGLGMGFERKVHNQLQVKGEGAYSALRIRHYGYDLAEERMEAKHRRTTTLLEEMVAADPRDAYSLFQLAASYSMHREFDRAVSYGERALAIMRRRKLKNSFFLTAFHTVAQGYFAQGQLAAAERICREALDFFPLHLDACHTLAALYFQQRLAGPCRASSERYLQIHAAITADPSLIGSYYCHSLTRRHEIFFGLACLAFIEKDLAAADRYFLHSFAEAERPRERALHIGRLYLTEGFLPTALAWLSRAAEAAPAPAADGVTAELGALAYDLAEALCRQRRWPEAETVLQRALRIAPGGFDPARFERLLPGREGAPPAAG
jgi:glycosyltransferase involved in cell wall biosynthesis